MYQNRILVVEDLPDVRTTIAGLLADEGYLVSSASNKAEALQLVKTNRFHLAVLDVRLDDADVNNQDGLLLMQEINTLDPTIATIILTGHPTVDVVRKALQPDNNHTAAANFLIKSELEELPDKVKLAFDNVLKINAALTIKDPERSLAKLHKHTRFVNIPRPPKQELAEEAEELFRKLFFDCEKIEIEPIKRGYSGTVVFKVTPWYQDRGQGEVLVAKLGEYALVDKEVDRYKRFVEGRVGGHRLPGALKVARTRSLSGILYTFAGLGQATDFAHFYKSATAIETVTAIKNLFGKTYFPWRHDSGFVVKDADLRAAYVQHLRLKPQELKMCLDNTMDGRHPFTRDDQGHIWLKSGQRLIDPVAFAFSATLRHDSYRSIIHGDLHGYNVIIDHQYQAWLIDFAHSGEGPLLQDYACFETFLRLPRNTVRNWGLIYEWERMLSHAPNLCEPDYPAGLENYRHLRKAHQAIITVRQLALHEQTGPVQRAYLIGLLFNALKIMTIMNLPAIQRDHALISAALIAERLQNEADL